MATLQPSLFPICSISQQWMNLCRLIDCGEWKKADTKNGIKISRLSFTNNDKATVKVNKNAWAYSGEGSEGPDPYILWMKIIRPERPKTVCKTTLI